MPNTAAQTAQTFLAAANALGTAYEAFETHHRAGATIDGEFFATCTVADHAEEVISALRRLAMALDRAAYISA